MTPTDLPSPAPDRAVADAVEFASTLPRLHDLGPTAQMVVKRHIDTLAARLSDALSQPVAQPEGRWQDRIKKIPPRVPDGADPDEWWAHVRACSACSAFREVPDEEPSDD